METYEQSLLKNVSLHLEPLIIPQIKESSCAINKLGQYVTLNVFQTMRVMQKAGDSFIKEELFEQLNFLHKYKKLYAAMLDILTQAGFIEIHDDNVIVTVKAEIEDLQGKMVEKKNEIFEKFPAAKPYMDLLWVCSQHITAILTGKQTAQNIMFPNSSMKLVEGIYRDNKVSDYFNQVTTKAVVAHIKAKLKADERDQKIKILEVGAGSGGTTTQVLKSISLYSNSIQYVYTDISKAFITFAKRMFENLYSFISFSLLNIEKDLQSQGYEANDFDIVIAVNILHATTNIRNTLKNIRRLLKRNGWLVLSEATRVENFATLTFGLLDGWWLFEDEDIRLKGSPLLAAKEWERILKEEGFREVIVLGPDAESDEGYSQHILLAEKNEADSRFRYRAL